jgi:O-antigen/teichoic acid export membrane protein
MLERRLSRSALWLLLSNLGSAGLAFLISVLIGRWLGERGLGIYSASLAWVYPLSILADAGLNTLLTRQIAQQPEREPVLLQASLRTRWIIAGGLAVALLLLAPILSADPAVVQGIQLSAPLVLLLPTFGLYTAIFRARQTMWTIPILNLGMLTSQAALTWIVLAGGGTVLDALVINTLTSAGQVIAAWWLYRYRYPHTTDDTQPATHRTLIALLREAWPFAVAGLLAALQMRVAFLMLERSASPEAVGQFAAAARLTEAGRVLPNAVFGALLPALSGLVTEPERYQHLFQRVFRGLVAYLVVVQLALLAGEGIILQLTYGPAFVRGTLALQVAALALIPGLVRALQTLAAYAQGREAAVNRVLAFGLLVQVALGLWLIPSWAAVGAAFSLAISETVMVSLLWWLSRQSMEQQ